MTDPATIQTLQGLCNSPTCPPAAAAAFPDAAQLPNRVRALLRSLASRDAYLRAAECVQSQPILRPGAAHERQS